MLSRLVAHTSMRRVLQQHRQELQNVVLKRDSGHNTMMIKPSNWDMKLVKNWFHFYLLLVGIPVSVALTIINIRTNPELIEVPEGYEPLPWEYYKHPITRWIARNMHYPLELEEELMLALHEYRSEDRILRRLGQKIDTVMKFYNDHRSIYFSPAMYGDFLRTERDEWAFLPGFLQAIPSEGYDDTYGQDSPVPVEGYKDGPIGGL